MATAVQHDEARVRDEAGHVSAVLRSGEPIFPAPHHQRRTGDPGQVEAVAAVGAGRLHVITFGVVPQVLPNFLSYILLRFESDIRSASVIGMVGGGGIGFYLWDTIRAFNDREAATVILLIVLMVMAVDVVSSRIRRLAI